MEQAVQHNECQPSRSYAISQAPDAYTESLDLGQAVSKRKKTMEFGFIIHVTKRRLQVDRYGKKSIQIYDVAGTEERNNV